MFIGWGHTYTREDMLAYLRKCKADGTVAHFNVTLNALTDHMWIDMDFAWCYAELEREQELSGGN